MEELECKATKLQCNGLDQSICMCYTSPVKVQTIDPIWNLYRQSPTNLTAIEVLCKKEWAKVLRKNVKEFKGV